MGAINGAIEQISQKKQAQEQMFAALEDNFGVEQKVLKDVYAKLGKGKPPHSEEEHEAAGEDAPEEHEDPDEI